MIADAEPSAACITGAAPVEQIATHIAEAPRHPRSRSPADRPAWDEAREPASDWDLVAQPEPELEFDQRITW